MGVLFSINVSATQSTSYLDMTETLYAYAGNTLQQRTVCWRLNMPLITITDIWKAMESVFTKSQDEPWCIVSTYKILQLTPVNPTSPKGFATTPQTVFAPVLKNTQPQGNMAPHIFNVILSS